MRDMEQYSDEELFAKMKDGNDSAIDYLMEKYSDLVRREARKFFLVGGDEEDLIQEGMIGLFKAVCGYDAKKNAGFSTFATLCIRRQLYTTVTASNRKKHGPLNHYISFFAQVGEDPDMVLEDVLSTIGQDDNPEELMLRKEEMDQYYQIMEKELSELEKDVVKLYLEGKSTKEIAQSMGRSNKSVDNAIQRIRKKLSGEG